jgi:MFS family permease
LRKAARNHLSQSPAVVGFGLTSFFSDLAHESVSAVLPLFLASLGAPPIGLGLVEGVSDAASSLFKLWGGSLADRLRRLKPAALGGYALTAVALPLVGLCASWWSVLVLRSLGWIGRGLRSPLRDRLLVASIPVATRGRAMGIERAMDQTGAMLAPLAVLALAAGDFELDSILLWAALPGLAAVIAFAAFVRELPRAEEPAAAAAASEPWPAAFRQLIAALALFGSGDFAKTLLVLWALGPIPADGGLGNELVVRGLVLYAFLAGVSALSAWIGGRLSDGVGRKPVLLAGYAAGVAGGAIPALAEPSTAFALAALALAGVLMGFQETVERAWAADLAPRGREGRALGIVHATNGVADLGASALVGALWTAWGARPAFAAATGLMALGLALVARVPRGPLPR